DGLDEAMKVFGADSGLVYGVDPDTGGVSIMSSFGYDGELLETMERKGVGNFRSCQACSLMKPVVVDDLATDDKCHCLSGIDTGSSICLPITSGEDLRGVLHLRRHKPDPFVPEDKQLAQAMTYQFALAMQRASLFEQVNHLAITDPLTGLYNYHKMNRDLARELTRSKRYNHKFAFIMADIDHFKAFNDRYGHQAGDEVLREVARALDTGRLDIDRVYRYGGEEFSILLPETDWREALRVAEKLRQNVEALQVDLKDDDEPPEITISMGVASFPYDSSEMETIAAAADKALYEAKELGRNQVFAYANLKKGS
ncbi:MAG: sensor domain-containing diguanylate cyclase, partial [Actinomycetia bacterium]|nr:sensor domain-containing diguanylate cyclase [Actinomycetes bacterium]